tara:strand:+ start:197 stop:940 length:744 start_codon:yes stop_codon:yes gene_type:complete
MFEELKDYSHSLKLVEGRVFDKKGYSYTIGVNVKDGEIKQTKLYVRLFARTPDMSLFCKPILDDSMRSIALSKLSSWGDRAFSKSGVGFKGFVLMFGIDHEDDEKTFGFGGRSIIKGEAVFEGVVLKDRGRTFDASKRVYKYEPKSAIKAFNRKLKYCTDTVEVQYDSLDMNSPKKVCLCPDFNRGNIEELSSKLKRDVRAKSRKLNNQILKSKEGFRLVNIGFDKGGEDKLYYHNFSRQNDIKGYL